jgi:hypothetical protein
MIDFTTINLNKMPLSAPQSNGGEDSFSIIPVLIVIGVGLALIAILQMKKSRKRGRGVGVQEALRESQ